MITVFPEPAIGHEWETRTIDFTVDATDSYTLILSNEDDRPSYLSLDAIILLEGCPPDLDGSGQVGFVDLSQLLGAWGACDANACPADLNCDSSVGFDDLVILLGEWGPC